MTKLTASIATSTGVFLGIDATLVMRSIPDVHFSAGSACTTGNAASHVLSAMGVSEAGLRSTMRISISWATNRRTNLGTYIQAP